MFFCQLASSAQNQDGNNLYEFMLNFYKDNPMPVTGDTVKRSGFAKEYDRTFSIWGPRLYPHGNARIAMQALSEYYMDFINNGPDSSEVSSINWIPLGPVGSDELGIPETNGIGQIHRITFDPQYGLSNQVIYAASFYGGLWKSVNNGGSWGVLNTDHQLPISSVSDIAIAFDNSNTLFISTGLGDAGVSFRSNPNWGTINPISTSGIYRSINAGVTWQPINNGFMEYFQTSGTTRRMIINPQNSNQLFVATSAGIFRTNNALATNPVWTRCIVGLDTTDYEYRGMEFQPGHPSTIYTSGKDIYRSTDGGNTWQSMTQAYGLVIDSLSQCEVNRINIAVTPADSTRLYAYIEGTYLCTNPQCRASQIAYIFMFRNIVV